MTHTSIAFSPRLRVKRITTKRLRTLAGPNYTNRTLRAGFSSQMDDEPSSEIDPDNLYAPIRGHVKNGFRELSRSLYT